MVARVLDSERGDYHLPFPPPDVAEQAALDAVADFLEAAAIPLRSVARSVGILAAVGEPAAALGTLARDRQVDLIAMATRGRGGGNAEVLGHTALRLLHRADAPLLLLVPAAAGTPMAAFP